MGRAPRCVAQKLQQAAGLDSKTLTFSCLTAIFPVVQKPAAIRRLAGTFLRQIVSASHVKSRENFDLSPMRSNTVNKRKKLRQFHVLKLKIGRLRRFVTCKSYVICMLRSDKISVLKIPVTWVRSNANLTALGVGVTSSFWR